MSNRDNKSAREERLAANLRVAELVKVVRFDAQTMTIDAQPLVQVAALSMGDFTIRPWYKKGDIGLIVICDKDIDAALDGKIAEPPTDRNHDITDAIFVGGIAKGGKAPSGLPSNALVLAAGGTYIAVKPDGIEINGTLKLNGVDMGNHTHVAPAEGRETGGPQ